MGIFGTTRPPFATTPDDILPAPAMSRRRSSFFPASGSISHPSPGHDARPSMSARQNSLGRPSMSARQNSLVRPSEPGVTTNFQTTFFGRKLSTAFVPPAIRKASLAMAARDRNPSHHRMGETFFNEGEETMENAFYNGRLSLDEADEDERLALKAKIAELRDAKGKGKDRPDSSSTAGWQTKLGWEIGPPKGKKGARSQKSKSSSRKHRQKRVMRELDSDLDAFNAYAQNGMASLTRKSKMDGAVSLYSLGNSVSSLHSDFDTRSFATTTDGGDLPDILVSDKTKAVPVGDGFDALDIMADHIFRIGVQKKKWFKPPKLGMKRDGIATGVSIRAKAGLYRTYPVDYEPLDEFEEAIKRLNPEVAIKVDSAIVRSIMRTYIDPSPIMSELIIDVNTRIQILDTIPLLARARKHQYAAFVRTEGVLVVWADTVDNIILAAEALEEALINFVWRGEEQNRKNNQAIQIAIDEKKDDEMDGLDPDAIKEEDMDPEDVEMRRVKRHWRERPTRLIAPMIDGMGIILILAIIALGLRTLVIEYMLDGGALRFVLAIFIPALCCVAAFACMCLVSSVWQIIGPIRQCTQNSIYYSGVAPKRTMGELSHVTIQMPVYKEGLDEVIRPTIESLKKAITTYERQGGSAGIIICDDGLQLLSVEEANQRRRFYFDNNIAYVARPGHNVNGFIRKGRFKKAGNMNYANALSLRIEEIMDDLRPSARALHPEDHFWSDNDENELYDTALAQGLEEKKGEAWASGNLRMGAILLLIDSDTRVPEDCFADAVSEMAESPEVAIIQHASGVMQVAHHFFENGVAHFTRGIQTAISYCCASGEVAPFVGHNAFIRWTALQECMYVDPDDGVRKIWSEDHVSEDFQIAVSLQMKGYVVRWASYTNGEFEEGVSLTCDDELNRWQKYAFGCSELCFHPLKSWLWRGPITPLFRNFVWSNIPLHSKITICGYIFSYYAISCAWALTVLNYFMIGWDWAVDRYYLTSWNITLVCLVLFGGICNVAFITLRYRLKTPDAAEMSFAQIKWIPFFMIFFSGMSMPMSAALVSHLVGYNMTWSSTVKTVQKSNFFLQVPLIWKRFYPQLTFFGIMLAGMAVMATVTAIPQGWRITSVEVIVPLSMIGASHILYPFALNPWFLSFSF